MFSIIYAKIYDEAYLLDKNFSCTVKAPVFYGAAKYI